MKRSITPYIKQKQPRVLITFHMAYPSCTGGMSQEASKWVVIRSYVSQVPFNRVIAIGPHKG